MIEASSDPVAFREAVEWFSKKLALTKDEWDQLTLEARRKAFTVANVTEAELVSGVKDALKRALEDGQSFDTWKKQIGPALEEAWGGERPWQLETIFRTNVQSAYGAGRYAQLTDPDVMEARPYWMFDAIMDSRTTSECAALHGTVLPATDKWWDGRIPPLHFNCRSSIRSLDEEQAKEQPKFAHPAPSLRGAEGFGMTPDKSEWEPDLEKYEDSIRRELKIRMAHGPDPSKLPRREPPVAIAGPAHGSNAKRGNQWQAGSVRADRVRPSGEPSGDYKPREPSPYHLDEELRPQGQLTAHPKTGRSEDELAVDEYLLAQGNDVYQRQNQSTKKGEKLPDADVNGVAVEYRTLHGRNLTLAFHDKARRGQAKHVIFDLRPSGMSLDEALRQLNTDERRSPGHSAEQSQKQFYSIRLIGRDFDVIIEP